MSLNGSMWTGVSGLNAHSQKMGVIGNNIANVGTVAFKGQRMDFADFVYQDTFSTAGISQVGRGVRVGTIIGNFGQGSYETTTNATDLSITGKGFFKVERPGSDEAYYTRAGNFNLDKDGYLKDPNHLVLQGWPIENDNSALLASGGQTTGGGGISSSLRGTGVPDDIKLDAWVVFPEKTSEMSFKVNLPSDSADSSKSSTNPFAALFENAWDGTQPPASAGDPAIAKKAYSEATTMEIYDESGTKHKITVYFDKVDSKDYTGGAESEEIWEYIVTMDPAEDKRKFWQDDADHPEGGSLVDVNSTKAGGLLMSGTMTFNSSGAMVGQSAYTWGGSQNVEEDPNSFEQIDDPADPLNELQVINLDPTDMANWQPAAISSNGLALLNPNFTGILDGQTSGSPNGEKYNIEMDLGLSASNFDVPWTNEGSLADLTVESYVYNPRYDASKPKTGPEFFLKNVNYNPKLTDPFHPNAYEYMFDTAGIIPYPGLPAYTIPAVTAVPDARPPIIGSDEIIVTPAELTAIMKYQGITEITIPAGTTFPGLAAGPADAILNADVTYNFETGVYTPAMGFAVDSTTPPLDAEYDFVAELGNILTNPPAVGTAAEVLRNILDTTVEKGKPTDRSVIKAATASNAQNLAGFTEPVVIDSVACTNLDAGFTSNQNQNGYGYGDLMSWSVDQDGVLTGKYSNNLSLPLWQIAMYDFNSTQGLYREGNNLFSNTMQSGEAKLAAANSGGMGYINGFSLEQSNVDMASELVQMIITQRGYQSNSKVITTTDGLLETVINMVR